MSEKMINLLSDAVKQFGVGLVFAAVFAFAVVRVYEDLAIQNREFIRLLERQTDSDIKLAVALEKLTDKISK